MTIRDRVIEVLRKSKLSTTSLEKETGIDRYIWANLKKKNQRVNEDHMEAINKLFPQFTYWIQTGKTIPEAGQISPDVEETRLSLKQGKAG